MAVQMSEEEKGLFYYLLNTPLVPDGVCPDWYITLAVSSRLRIPPWVLDGVEPTDEIRAFWKDKTLQAIQIELWVEEIKKKNPDWFKDSFDPHKWLLEQLRHRRPQFRDDDFLNY